MEQTKIAFTGPQGSGKTTAILEMAADLRKQGKHAGIVTEVVRKAPKTIAINEQATGKSQMWIFGQMIAKELAAPDEIIICDRTLLDVVAYTARADEAAASAMRPFVEYYLQTYDIIFYLEPREEYLVADGVRSTNQQFQQEISRRMNNEVVYFDGMASIAYEKDHKKRMEIVTEIIKRKE